MEGQVDRAKELRKLPGLRHVSAHHARLPPRQYIVNPDGSAPSPAATPAGPPCQTGPAEQYQPAATRSLPLLLLDMDGVLNPFAASAGFAWIPATDDNE